jgi:hypothetical protein
MNLVESHPFLNYSINLFNLEHDFQNLFLNFKKYLNLNLVYFV